ncbi:unnamed protein product [Larinioides sclopetarius]|uniref:Uncharacterized protein n=1 Tax=Larinioides sclopetarius TaxID=280406 RepID=A0AAV2ARL7_9ARAC
MSKLPAFLSSFNNLLTAHPVCFTNSLLIVLSAGGEKIFQSVAFVCPKDPELARYYGLLFLIAPLFILLVSGMALHEGLWHVYHGCLNRSEGAGLTQKQVCHSFWSTFFRSLIVPCAWLFVSLLDGTYIVCSLGEDPTQKTEESDSIRAISQMAGWIFLVAVVIVGTTVTCCMRCNAQKTFLELHYIKVYKKVEKEELEKKMNEKAEKMAKVNVISLFSEDLPPKETWDKVTVPVVSEDSDAAYYSSLHKWSDEKKNQNSSA